MRRLPKLVVAGLSVTAGLMLGTDVAAAASPERELDRCLAWAVEQDDVAGAVDSCIADYLASLDLEPGDTVNSGFLGSATDGGVNTAPLGSADGEGAVNTAILGSASV